jgi:hypothetical protein
MSDAMTDAVTTSTGTTGAAATSTSSASGGTTSSTGTTCSAPSMVQAGRSSEGVLTNYPALHFTQTGGQFQITSAYFQFDAFSTFNSVEAWGEIKNVTATRLCIPLKDQFQIDAQDVILVADGPAYSDFGTASLPCIEPGQSGTFRAIQNDVAATVLSGATTLSYSIVGLSSSTAVLDPDDPKVVSAAPTQTAAGWTLSGTMQAGPGDINNLAVTVYVRDPSGLIVLDLTALPQNLATIPASSQFAFETDDAAPQRFCDYVRFDSFIDGPQTLALGADTDPMSEQAKRVRLFEAEKRRLLDAR